MVQGAVFVLLLMPVVVLLPAPPPPPPPTHTQMGVGLHGGVCPSTCDKWFDVCATSFFEFDAFSGALIPSGRDSQRSLISGLLEVNPAGT